MLGHSILEAEKNRRRQFVETLTSDLDVQALMLDFFEGDNATGVKRDQFYRILDALALPYRSTFVSGIPEELLQKLHPTVADFKRTMLVLMIEVQHLFLEKFKGRYLERVFSVKRVSSMMDDIDMRAGAGSSLPAATAYHTERQLLYCLAVSYCYRISNNNRVRDATLALLTLIKNNGNPFDLDRFSSARWKASKKHRHILKRYEFLYNERYRKFSAKPGQVHVALDLDESLVSDVERANCSETTLRWFTENNFIIAAIGSYLIHPGAIEFLQYLLSDTNIRISFYSGGADQRNRIIVADLLTRAVGAERFEQIKDAVTIFSRCDLEDSFAPTSLFAADFRYSVRMKNLRKITAAENMQDTILIDDDSSICCPGQERNMLIHRFDKDKGCSFDDPYQANHIFYIAGVLRGLLENRGRLSLSEALFRFQYAEQPRRTSPLYPYVSQYWVKQRNNSYYRSGLALLQTMNRKLEFFGGKSAKFLETQFSPDEYRRRADDASSVNADLFTQIPVSIKLNIFTFFDAQARAAAGRVSRDWKDRCRELPAPRMG